MVEKDNDIKEWSTQSSIHKVEVDLDFIKSGMAGMELGIGLFYRLLRGRPIDSAQELRQRFSGTVFGRLLDAAENGDTGRLYSCIGRIEYSLLRASRIMVRSRPTRAEFLSDVRDFLRMFGLSFDVSLRQGYRNNVPRSAFPKV